MQPGVHQGHQGGGGHQSQSQGQGHQGGVPAEGEAPEEASRHPPDYVRPVFPSASGRRQVGGEAEEHGGQPMMESVERGAGAAMFSRSLDHPHYHQWEDEVCLKCDTMGVRRPESYQRARLPSVPSVEVHDYTDYTPTPFVQPTWGPSKGRQLPQAPVQPNPPLRQHRPVSDYGPPRFYSPR